MSFSMAVNGPRGLYGESWADKVDDQALEYLESFGSREVKFDVSLLSNSPGRVRLKTVTQPHLHQGLPPSCPSS